METKNSFSRKHYANSLLNYNIFVRTKGENFVKQAESINVLTRLNFSLLFTYLCT